MASGCRATRPRRSSCRRASRRAGSPRPISHRRPPRLRRKPRRRRPKGNRTRCAPTRTIAESTERLLVRSALDALAIAGKAGAVATGFSRVEEALARTPVAALLHAADAGTDGVAKLAAALRHRPDAERIATITRFSTAQLG